MSGVCMCVCCMLSLLTLFNAYVFVLTCCMSHLVHGSLRISSVWHKSKFEFVCIYRQVLSGSCGTCYFIVLCFSPCDSKVVIVKEVLQVLTVYSSLNYVFISYVSCLVNPQRGQYSNVKLVSFIAVDFDIIIYISELLLVNCVFSNTYVCICLIAVITAFNEVELFIV